MFRNFLGYVKLPSAAKKATLAALLFMMFESSSKFIATKLNRPNNLVNNCKAFTFFSKIIDQKRYSNVDELRVRNFTFETSRSKHRVRNIAFETSRSKHRVRNIAFETSRSKHREKQFVNIRKYCGGGKLALVGE